jgi:hypothetical protein
MRVAIDVTEAMTTRLIALRRLAQTQRNDRVAVAESLAAFVDAALHAAEMVPESPLPPTLSKQPSALATALAAALVRRRLAREDAHA